MTTPTPERMVAALKKLSWLASTTVAHYALKDSLKEALAEADAIVALAGPDVAPVCLIPDPLKPALSLVVKLGSIAVHADELLSPDTHVFDKVALESLMTDPEVTDWIAKMTDMAMVPRKRKS